MKQTQADVKNAWNTIEAQKISAKQSAHKRLPHGTFRIEQSARKLKSLKDCCSTKRRNKKAMNEKKECSLGLSYTKLNSSYTKNYEIRIRPVKRPLPILRKLSYPN